MKNILKCFTNNKNIFEDKFTNNFTLQRIQKWSHQNTLKMECSISPFNIHILKIALRENSKPRFLHLIKFSKNKKIFYILQDKTTNRTKQLLIRTYLNEVLTLSSETSSSEYYFDIKPSLIDLWLKLIPRGGTRLPQPWLKPHYRKITQKSGAWVQPTPGNTREVDLQAMFTWGRNYFHLRNLPTKWERTPMTMTQSSPPPLPWATVRR